MRQNPSHPPLKTASQIQCHILGCGSSGGVPRINGDWGVCDPHNPKNRRTRCSVLFEQIDLGEGIKAAPEAASAPTQLPRTRLLIDTSPDLRAQFLAADIDDIDAIAFTHDHADQTHGIDDIRALVYARGARIPTWMDDATRATLSRRFGYCFETPAGSSYPALLDTHMIPNPAGGTFTVAGAGGEMAVTSFRQIHGSIDSLGFRIGDIAYSSDLNDLPEESFEHLQGLSCWIIDALRLTPHPSHLHLDAALALIDRVQPKKAVLTNLHIDMDYEALKAQLDDHIAPAFDGMVIVDTE